MDQLFSIVLGKPKHGWLPVDFHYNNFHLEFAASDVLNDPLDELCKALIEIRENETKRITWWLEPAAYFFDFEKKGQIITLTIIETDDLQKESFEEKKIVQITGDEKEILLPFRSVLKQFFSQTYEENDWSYKFDKSKTI